MYGRHPARLSQAVEVQQEGDRDLENERPGRARRADTKRMTPDQGTVVVDRVFFFNAQQEDDCSLDDPSGEIADWCVNECGWKSECRVVVVSSGRRRDVRARVLDRLQSPLRRFARRLMTLAIKGLGEP